MSTDWKERAEAAEKTVEVLTRKVVSLYRGESTSTIQRQLDRAQKRQERTQQRRQLTEVRATELARYSEGLEIEVADRTRALRTILDHVTSGLLVIDADLVVRAGHSQSCQELLGAEVVAGVSLLKLLGVTDPQRGEHVASCVEQAFEDVLPEKVATDMIPKRFALGTRILNVDARVIRRDRAICGLLLTISDVTDLEHAEREARENQTLLRILKARDAFREFIVDAHELLAASRDAVRDGNHVFIRRALHTIKGNAGSYDLDDLAELVHTIEAEEVITVAEIDLIERSLRAFLALHASVLELDYGTPTEDHFDVAASTIDELRQVTPQTGIVGLAVERWSAKVVLKRADAMLGPLGAYVSKLAERLEKCVGFTLLGGETMVDARHLRPVLQSLTHVLRNAVDHGVELPEERGDKPPRARIEVTLAETAEAWTVRVSDDGRGIDTNELVKQAESRGLLSAERAAVMTEREKLELVFAEGLSTAPCATDISGRGVGMSAVLGAVQDRGGHVTVASTQGAGTTIVLHVPKPVALRPPARNAA